MAAGGDECCTQLIGGDGSFNVEGLERFLKTVRLAECGLSYAVVSIMGPQSSGKSTLLNHLFRTKFREMDAFKGRTQTTKGIWIAKGIGIEPCTIVMDLEGTDGRERGEDDTTFEKQSALFALAISDVVLINMWCHDIGREHAANKPLLKTVFQVMMRLFSPRKTTLLFVIRDKTKTPLELLEPILQEDVRKIWASVSKPQIHKDTPLGEFFNIEVTALPSLEEKEELFKEKVVELRQLFFHSIAPGGLAGDRRGVIPASGFSFSAQQIWKVIQENKDLDLPSHKIMVATVRCEEIANEKLHLLSSDKNWLELMEAVQVGPLSSFGKRIGSLIDSYLSGYDMETIYFDDGVRTEKRKQLESNALHLVYPAFQAMLGHLRSKALSKFKRDLEKSLKSGSHFATSFRRCTETSLLAFDTEFKDVAIKHSDWDAFKVREKLRRDIEAHALSVRSLKLSQLKAHYEKQVNEAFTEPLQSLFDAAGHDTWTSIRNLYVHIKENALLGLSSDLSCFELSQDTYNNMLADLNDYARSVVERIAKEEAGKVLMHMKDRFSMVFSHDKDSMPRLWTGKENIRMITKDARSAGLKVLSALAAIRLDDRNDKIESALISALHDTPISQNQSTKASADPLASSTWEGVSLKDTLITPVECKSIWRQFLVETEYTIAQAISAQEAHRRSNSWLPPPWAIAAIAVLGFNEFMILLRNPLYLFILFVLYLLARAMRFELDFTGEFQNGTISGLLALTSRFLPTVMNLLRRLTDDGGGPNQLSVQHPQSLINKSKGGYTSSKSVVDSSSPSSSSKCSSSNTPAIEAAEVDSNSNESSA